MLDLLRVGGRCAVIIPEGVLFGNTAAHVQLRRELLTEHVVEGVISLPGGVFQPYTGVKTSILIFRKETKRDNKESFTGAKAPRSEYLWFYEVEQDGYTLNAKRNERPGEQNDLWDALEKFKAWLAHGRDGAQQNEKTLLQPSFQPQRWRHAVLRDTADKLTPAGEAFASEPDSGMWDGKVWGIHELFADDELPQDPKEAEHQIKNQVHSALSELAYRYFAPPTEPVWKRWHETGKDKKKFDPNKAMNEWQKAIKPAQQEFNRAAREVQKFFESEDSAALPIWKWLVKDALNANLSFYEHNIKDAPGTQLVMPEPIKDLVQEMQAIARQVAKLDGFDVTLRSLAVDRTNSLKDAKHWVVPVRAWARNDEWQSEDGTQLGSHHADGLVRPAYVEAMLAEGLYDGKGKLKEDLLDPDCIEARDWNLSAGQYKPFDFTQLKSDKSVTELIGELKSTEQQIISGLDKLLAMVEG